MKRQPREPKPFYKASHKAWYVQKDGKQHRLGPVMDDEAKRRYHQILAAKPEEKPADPVVAGDDPIVATLIDDFLFSVQQDVKREKLAPRTYDWYYYHLSKFASYLGEMKLSAFKKTHLKKWLETDYPDAGNNYLNGAVRTVSRLFNWAIENELISTNPIAHFKRPSYTPRECYLTESQWKTVLSVLKADGPFIDFIWFLRLTGCRPHEARIVTDAHFDGDSLVLERLNSKSKRKRRVILLEGKALEIVKRRTGNGFIFTNHDGNQWTSYALNCRFTQLRKKLAKKLEKKDRFPVFAYAFRHTFITDALKRGVNPSTVATLVGSSVEMISRVYSHLYQDNDHLRAEMRRAVG